MISRMFRVFALLLVVSMVATARPGAGPRDSRRSIQGETRGLWVLRTSLTSPTAIANVVRAATEGGYNTLLVQVRSRGDAFYTSDVDPRSADLSRQPKTFDPLATMLDQAHAAGLKVHAWVNINLVSSAVTLPQSPEHVVSRHPEWLMVPRALAVELRAIVPNRAAYRERLARWTRGQRASIEGLFLSPILDAAQDYTISVVAGLVRRYDVDGVHLDYIRYPSEDFDYSAAALDAFRTAHLGAVTPNERDTLDRALKADPLAWTRAYPEVWTAFRQARLTTLVRRIRQTVKAARPAAVLSSAVIPNPGEARDAHFQDWERWAETGVLDAVCPMAYSTSSAGFADQVENATAAAHGLPVWMGIGAWRLPVRQTANHLAISRRAGAAGVVLFSYDSLSAAGSPPGTYLAHLRPSLLSEGLEPSQRRRP